MNPKSRNSLTIGLFALLLSCSSRFTKDYHDPSFSCFSGPGFRNSQDFSKYRNKAWLPYRLILREENQRLKKSRIVLAGNSLAHLFLPELLEREFPKTPIANRGIGGDMTDTLLERFEEDVLALQPSLVVLEIGGNDLIQGKCLGFIQKNVEDLVSLVQTKSPSTRLVFLAVPPTTVADLNRIVPTYNLFLAGLAKRYKNVEYVELWDEMRETDLPTIKPEFVRPGDPIHFNEKGYEVWGKKLRPYL